MTPGDTRVENAATLFSLPEAAPGHVLRVGELLKAAGHPLDAIEIYEHFIAGLQQHALCPVQAASPGSPTGARGEAAKLPRLLPVRAHPKRYSLA